MSNMAALPTNFTGQQPKPSDQKECEFCKTRNLICNCGENCEELNSHVWRHKPASPEWEEALAQGLRNHNSLYLEEHHRPVFLYIKSFISDLLSSERKQVIEEVKKAVLMADVESISHYGSAGAGIIHKSMIDYLDKELKKL